MSSINHEHKNLPEHPATSSQEEQWWSWEEMQDGIFTKIEQEDPDFFKRKRRRNLPWLLLLGLVGISMICFLAGVLGTRYWRHAPHPVEKLQYALTEKSLDQPFEHRRDPATSFSPTRSQQKPGIKHSPGTSEAYLDVHASKNENSIPRANSEDKAATTTTDPIVTPLGPVPSQQGISEMHFLASKAMASLKPDDQPFSERVIPMNLKKKMINESKWSLSLMVIGSYSQAHLPGNSAAGQLRNNATGSLFGAGAGIRWHKENSGILGWYVSGSFHRWQQTIDVFSQRRVDYLQRNAVVGINTYIGSNRSELVYKDTLIKATEQNRLVSHQTVNAIALEGGLSKTFGQHAWNFQTLLGARMSYLFHGKGYTVGEDFGIIPLSQWRHAQNRAYLAMTSDFLVHRKLHNRCSIWFGPGFNVAIADKIREKGPLGRSWNLQWSMGLRKQL